MMDERTFLDFKISTTIDCHHKAWNGHDIFHINKVDFILKKKVIYTRTVYGATKNEFLHLAKSVHSHIIHLHLMYY